MATQADPSADGILERGRGEADSTLPGGGEEQGRYLYGYRESTFLKLGTPESPFRRRWCHFVKPNGKYCGRIIPNRGGAKYCAAHRDEALRQAETDRKAVQRERKRNDDRYYALVAAVGPRR
jgi:hypothetical protein